jgi:hypothetical protein
MGLKVGRSRTDRPRVSLARVEKEGNFQSGQHARVANRETNGWAATASFVLICSSAGRLADKKCSSMGEGGPHSGRPARLFEEKESRELVWSPASAVLPPYIECCAGADQNVNAEAVRPRAKTLAALGMDTQPPSWVPQWVTDGWGWIAGILEGSPLLQLLGRAPTRIMLAVPAGGGQFSGQPSQRPL